MAPAQNRFSDPISCAQEAVLQAKKSNKNIVLLSNSLGRPQLQLVLQVLDGGEILTNETDPDPLGFEDLLDDIGPHLAAVIYQNPGYFGTLRDLTALESVCRQHHVPLLSFGPTPTESDLEAAQSLARALGRVRGVRVVTDRYATRFSLYLDGDTDAANVAESLAAKGFQGLRAAGLDYPEYPELHPVLIVDAPQDATLLAAALAEVLAQQHQPR